MPPVQEDWGQLLDQSNRTKCRQPLAIGVAFLRSYPAQVLSRGDGPATRSSRFSYTFRRNTASEDLIWYWVETEFC